MSAHPSRLVLERFSVQDLPPNLQAEAAGHIESCTACQALLAELTEAQTALLEKAPPAEFLARVAERRDRDASLSRRRLRFGVVTATAIAAAAAMLLVVLVPRTGDQVRFKGAGVTIQRLRGELVAVLIGSELVTRCG